MANEQFSNGDDEMMYLEPSPAAWLHYTDARKGNMLPMRLPIWQDKIVKIGRDERANCFTVKNDPSSFISRNHCEIYVVTYSALEHLVYVRDRKSSNGTFVNGQCIGNAKLLSPGYLLNDGDVIELRPHWQFKFEQVWNPHQQWLSPLQLMECKLFEHKYVVLPRTLGDGAEATAHLAIEVKTGRQLVCKLINTRRTSIGTPKDILDRAMKEADVLRQLQHPNILSYVDSICSPHTVYTFSELASGGDLCSFIQRHETVSEFDSRVLLRQITRGLQFLHGKGIIHRDLKPENILLANSPKIAYQRVILSDFGTCSVPHRSGKVTYVGTEAYQAPEFKAKTIQTPAVDMWSLGIITIALLTGKTDLALELKDMDQLDMMTSILNRLSLSTHDAKTFILNCLQLEPSDRLTAIEAYNHDWLCRPVKEREFFEELDRRMLEGWSEEVQLRPMPIQIDDVAPIMSQVYKNRPPTRAASSPADITSYGPKRLRQPNTTNSTHQRVKLLQDHGIKVPDYLHLPLTSLDKHLTQTTSSDYRERILQQLRMTSAKFL